MPDIDTKLGTLPEWSGGFVNFSRVMHPKYMVVDGEAAWIGTSNWSGEYFYESRNAGLIVRGVEFASQLEDYFGAGWDSEYVSLLDPCVKYEAPRRDGE